MKAEEAIKCFKPIVDNEAYTDRFQDACKLAIEALEKQIPKKPDFEGDGFWDGKLVYDTWICPCCEKHYEVDYDDYDYCPNCGQALDWSEEERAIKQAISDCFNAHSAVGKHI